MRIPLGLRAAAGNTGGPVGPSNPWDIDYASFTGTPENWFYIGGQDLNIHGVTFKSDGTKMYIAGSNNDSIYEYNLSTAWSLGTATYVQSLDVSGQDTAPTGLHFKPDGTVLYVSGNTGDSVYQYSLSTAWNISTASYVQSFSVASQEAAPSGVFFKTDGTKMYVIGTNGDDVNEYDLSTAWDISTASYLQNFSVATQETAPQDVFFKDDGTKMYITGGNTARLQEYSLSTAWDVSTATYTQDRVYGVTNIIPRGLFFKSDGSAVFVADAEWENVYKFDLSTAWDVSTASFTYPSTDYFDVSTEETTPTGLYFKDDGTKMYIIGAVGDDINEYSLSTAWEVHTASYVQSFSIAAKDVNPLGLFFKSDGTEVYIAGNEQDSIHQYTLSTAWDISTASFTQSFSVATQDLAPESVFFKDDGTKMYVLGNSGNDVNEYSLSTAWDISTASYVQVFSVSTQDSNPTGLFFKSDGTKMYVTGEGNDSIYEYSLSTAWDISTASYGKVNTLIPFRTRGPEGVFFKPDGGKMFIIDSNDDAVWAFTIS